MAFKKKVTLSRRTQTDINFTQLTPAISAASRNVVCAWYCTLVHGAYTALYIKNIFFVKGSETMHHG